jgi:hypothetical protein
MLSSFLERDLTRTAFRENRCQKSKVKSQRRGSVLWLPALLPMPFRTFDFGLLFYFNAAARAASLAAGTTYDNITLRSFDFLTFGLVS